MSGTQRPPDARKLSAFVAISTLLVALLASLGGEWISFGQYYYYYVPPPVGAFTFTATVEDRGGNRLANQTVMLQSSTLTLSCSTNAQGQCSILATGGSYTLRTQGFFSGPGSFANWDITDGVVNLTQNTATTITIQNVYFSGTVRDPNGTPVPNVSLLVLSSSLACWSTTFGGFSGGACGGGSSNAQGNFNLFLLPGSSLVVQAIPPQGSGLAPTTFSGISLLADTAMDLVLSAPVTFTATVVDRASTPLANQTVMLQSPSLTQSCSTNAQGQCSIQVPSGSYTLRTQGFFSGPGSFANWDITDGVVNLTQNTATTITIQNVYFSGMVRDPNGNPVPNVSLLVLSSSLACWSTSFGGFSGGACGGGASDAQGNFNLFLLPGSNLVVQATPPQGSGLAPTTFTGISLLADTVQDLVLPAPVTFSATVVDRASTPLANQTVMLQSPSSTQSCSTNAQGQCSIQVPSGSYTLRVQGGRSSPGSFASWDITDGAVNLTQNTATTITIQNVFLSGTVRDPNGNPVSDVSLQVLSVNLACWSTSFGPFTGGACGGGAADAQGNFSLFLLPGSNLVVQAFPPPASGLAPTAFSGVSVLTDTAMTLVLSGSDSDGDGILNSVDTSPTTFSNGFSDAALGGTTGGTTVRGDRAWFIGDVANDPNTPINEGVRVIVGPGSQVAQVQGTGGACVPGTLVGIPPTGADFVFSCSSTSVEVTAGSVIVSVNVDGLVASVQVDAAGGVTFSVLEDGTLEVTNTGTVPLSGTIGEEPLSLGPGETEGLLVVEIDIKPGSLPNSINPKSRGRIPVAILSTPAFDAPGQVDKASLSFGRTGDERSLGFCNGAGEDVNGDGLLDQVCHFETQRTGFKGGDTAGVLKGQTVDRVAIRAEDTIDVVPG